MDLSDLKLALSLTKNELQDFSRKEDEIRARFEQELRLIQDEKKEALEREKRLEEVLSSFDSLQPDVTNYLSKHSEKEKNDNEKEEIDPLFNSDIELATKFKDLTIEQSAELIAKENNGRLDTTEAREILIRAGKFQNAKKAKSSLLPALSRSPKFERIGEIGEGYKLKNFNYSSQDAVFSY
jgi:hypothetical protein